MADKKVVRKKSTRLSREVRQREILDAARQVFEQQGYEKAKVSDIADMIGVVEGTIFSYFSSKRVLVLKVMEQFYDEITAVIDNGIHAVQGTRNRLHFVIWNHLNIVSENRALCAVILRESRGLDKKLAQEVHELNKRYTHAVGELVRDGQALGDIRENMPSALVRNVIFGTIEHYLWDLVSGMTTMDIDAVARDLTELMFHGITERPESASDDVSALIHKLNKLL